MRQIKNRQPSWQFLICELRRLRLSGCERSAAAGLSDLFQAHFEGTAPNVKVTGGLVQIHQRHSNWLRPTSGEVTLNTTIPWRIDLLGGASKVQADLRGLQLSRLEVTGGANELALLLPPPKGTVSVRISGGVSKTSIRRPHGVAARVRSVRARLS